MGRFGSFMTWYRLKSDPTHLFVKISGVKFIEEQPVSLEDADIFSLETLEGTRDMREILAADNRILVVKLDLRDIDYSQLHILPFIKYASRAASLGLDMDYFEVVGAGEYWTYVMSFAPKYLRERMILIT